MKRSKRQTSVFNLWQLHTPGYGLLTVVTSKVESLAYIACVLQQLLQTPLAVLIEIYFEVMRTLLALVVTILFTLYTVACVQIQLQWSFSSYLSEALATTV